jgi:hypothetical protein
MLAVPHRPAPEEINMRDISLIAATALITALITAWSMHALGTSAPAKPSFAPASMNVMQMMRDAKGLPEEYYDAF